MMKMRAQNVVRKFHAAVFDRGLPDKVAVYLHSIDRRDYQAFTAMLSFFADHAYRLVGPDEFTQDSRDKVAFVSFDDCHAGWYEALPLFRELGQPLTFYVNTGCFRDKSTRDEMEQYFNRLEFSGPRVSLSTAELSSIRDEGFTIGAHGHSHCSLVDLSPQQAKADILQSKLRLEGIVGAPVRHFAYPFGMRRYFNDELRSYCRAIGFSTIANGIPGLQHARQSAYDLNRTQWLLDHSLPYNVKTLQIDGRWFERITGRSATG
jgi:peptidoglycan/xylan/chitin deacetylase (PgdA/CDA1 family)